MKISNGWKIVLIATGFNLLFEYSLRGANNVVEQPLLPPVLFTSYLTYFTILENLIVKYRLKDYHLMIASFFYGTIGVCFASGLAFTPPLLLGINWPSLLFVNLVWWGAIQAIVTFYVANRLAPRDWNHGLLSKTGWAVALFLNGSTFVIFQLNQFVPRGTSTGHEVTIFVLIIAAVIFQKTLPNKEPRNSSPAFKKDKVMDYLSLSTAILFFVCAVLLIHDPTYSGASHVNQTSLKIILVWTAIVALAILVYRFHSKKEIPV